AAVVDVVLDPGGSGEALLAVLDAVLGQVHQHQALAGLLQILRPTAVPGADLEDRSRREERVDAGKHGAVPHGFRSAPPRGPLVALLRPVPGRGPDFAVLVDAGHAATL